MADVFISYCRAGTSDLARRIAQRLDDLGISYWYDKKSVNVGGIADFITREIQDCKVFLLLWDEGANVSPYVFAEVHTSFSLYRRQIVPIPVQIGRFTLDSDLKFYLGAFNILSYDSPEAVPVEELARTIAELLGKTSKNLPRSGYCGRGKREKDVTYQLYHDGRFVISGSGPMKNYLEPEHAPWHYQKEEITSVRIENGVTSIGSHAFYDCNALTSVKLPDSLTSIESFAFCGCAGLTSVQIPNSVTSIVCGAFERCKGLTSVRIPDSVTFIGYRAFRDCVNLTSVNVPANAKIGYRAFDDNIAASPSP